MGHHLFKNRKLLIATKHAKEEVMAPILEKQLGVACYTDPNLDTDLLGTFSGEIERELDPVATLKKKCLWAMEQNNCDLAVASEGSFGPHPTIFFSASDDEFVILIDKKNNLEIIARHLTTETNFAGKEVHSFKELLDFSEETNFPSHSLILKVAKDDTTHIIKDCNTSEALEKGFNMLYEKYGSVYAETDMRAMHNPTRMQVIKKATEKLIAKINTACPNCNTPGFDVFKTKEGLQCGLCGAPTKSILSLVYRCKKCSFEKEEMYPNDRVSEDPMYCNFCNP